MEQSGGGGGGTGEGFDVARNGDARIALIGFPSVGKSSLLNEMTTTESEAAGYGTFQQSPFPLSCKKTSLLTNSCVCYMTSRSQQRIHNPDLYSWRATLQRIQDTGPRFAVGQYIYSIRSIAHCYLILTSARFV